MALVIEDGSIVVGANSYVSIAELTEYLADRGADAQSDSEATRFLTLSAQYLGKYEAKYRGSRVSAAQELSWPRTEACVNGFLIADDMIPSLLKQAQLQLSLEGVNGFEFFTSSDGTYVVREKVDVLETQYATPVDLVAGGLGEPSFPAVDALLGPLLRRRSQLMTARAW